MFCLKWMVFTLNKKIVSFRISFQHAITCSEFLMLPQYTLLLVIASFHLFNNHIWYNYVRAWDLLDRILVIAFKSIGLTMFIINSPTMQILNKTEMLHRSVNLYLPQQNLRVTVAFQSNSYCYHPTQDLTDPLAAILISESNLNNGS